MDKDRLICFLWQHVLLLVSLFFLSLGVALCIRSNLGSSVISSAPYVLTLAGQAGLVPRLSLGMYTNILNVLLIIGQVIVLRSQFRPIQLLQLFIGCVFGVLIDLSMFLTAFIVCSTMPWKFFLMVVGSSVMALGVSMEIRCASVTMPGEGLPAAIAKMTGKAFSTVKVYVDVSLVGIAVIFVYVFFGHWMWNVVGIGTLFAMVYCGMAVKFISRRIDWFDRMLGYRPGFRRYFYGLAKYVQAHRYSRR